MSTASESITAPAKRTPLKPVLGFLLVAAAAAAIVVGVLRQNSPPGPEATVSTAAAAPTSKSLSAAVTVYYFHGNTRCPTCQAIEARTERLVREQFAAELASGVLRYAAVNYDIDANRHFRTDFDLSFGSVVVQGRGDGKAWENLSEVWSLIHDDDLSEFDAYIFGHISKMLETAG